MMNGLRRALLLGLPRARWHRPFGAPVRRSSGEALLRHVAAGGPTPSRQKPPRPRWEAAEIAAQEETPEEEFFFPEYLPEEPSAEGKSLALQEKQQQQEAETGPEPQPRTQASDSRRQHPQPGRRERKPPREGPPEVFGRPDPSVPSSGVSCSGCGAELHCRDPAVPGYLPSEKYLSLVGQQEEEEEEGELGGGEGEQRRRQALEGAVCQRCWFLVHRQRALQVQVSREEYRRVVSAALRSPPRHGRPPLVLCMVDVLDLPDALLPDLPELVGSEAHVFVLGNKVDLLPGDSPTYLKRLRERLLGACAQAGLLDPSQPREAPGRRVVDVHLLSAKTGYGVEELISKLQRSWKFNGDVYLVGTVNTGKSTLFNTLLHSDYCKSRASDVINRATISPWPGTTLNLLKFPIINPTPYRIFRRKERLMADAEKAEEDLSEEEQKQIRILKKQGYLIGRIGRTFQLPQKLEKNCEIDFDFEALSLSMEEDLKGSMKGSFLSPETTAKKELTYNEVKDARWFFDTPGIVKDGCVLNLLKEKEVKLVLPTCAIVPRTFVLKPGMTLFLGALGRIDYIQGDSSSWFSVVASNLLPVHITTVEKADDIYQKHAGQTLLKVPMGGEERMKGFPPLVPQDVILEGIGDDEAVADIKLSSAGWVAVTAHSYNKMHLKCYAPERTTLMVRKPPLLPYIVQIKGERIKRSSAYRPKKPPPLVENLKGNENKKKKLGIIKGNENKKKKPDTQNRHFG
ncbi:nitric oxide-associated protein 1 [Hemicordylus capensis]|uniref:nitric oxide-associated protein 1 n=1 Tax=Hemicordylus capensis TaxID=884348 RepID=UPI00230393B8|nr:nitric oxide-associated protein 1 [Hemicordylus capensis]